MTLQSLVAKCIETKLQRESIAFRLDYGDAPALDLVYNLTPIAGTFTNEFRLIVSSSGLDFVIVSDNHYVMCSYLDFATANEEQFRGLFGAFLEIYHSFTTFYSLIPA